MPDDVTPPEVAEEMIKTYFEAVLRAFNEKAQQYFQAAGDDKKEQFIRVTNIKDGLKGIGKPHTFGIGAGPYSSCPSGVCTGGVCTSALNFGDMELAKLAQDLGIHEDVG